MTELTQLERMLDATGIGKWRAYPSYKDSGVEWLGEIPEHWEVWKISRAFSLIGSGTTPLTSHEEYYNGDIPWVNTTELRDSVITDTAKKLTHRAVLDYPTLRLYPAGTLLVALYGATIGKVGVLQIPATTNQACCAIFNSKHLVIDFTFYWFLAFRQQLILLASGGGQPNISQDTVRTLRIATPPLPEQHAIAAFLTREISKINTLITKKERLIELLQEKRAALISHVVTKGLDPDVKMKDSGVEWLGEIPAHWEVRRLKFCLTSIEQGWSPPCENRPAEIEEWGVLKVGCVNGVNFNSDENKALPSELDPIPEFEIKSGDVLMSRANTRELLGSASLVMQVRPRLLLCDKLYRLRLIAEVINSAYFVFAMGSHGVRFQLERDATGASNSMQNISQGTILNLVIPLPDITEQQSIISYLDQETARIDALISRISEAIEKLKEYSAALISAAVTGKIDVRVRRRWRATNHN